MTDPRGVLLRYGRAGGRAPSDDESLEVATDGAWTARRTVGGRRIGRFAGRLPEKQLAALARDAARAAGAGDAEVPTPRHGATETLETGGAVLRLGSNERAQGGWRPLVEWARSFVKGVVTSEPVAVLALEADVAAARLVLVGTEPIEVDPGSIAIRVALVAPDGTRLGDWQAGSGAEPGWARAEAGWTLDLPFGHGLSPGAGEFLQVRVVVRVRDRGTRAARLFLAVPLGEVNER